MRVVFRTDSSAEIGSGHVMRCLTLAKELRRNGAEIVFVARSMLDYLQADIAQNGYALSVLPPCQDGLPESELAHAHWLGASQTADAEATVAAVGELPIDWLVIDHYALDRVWETRLRHCARHLLVIDDLADRGHDCDLLLDQNFRRSYNGRYDRLVPVACLVLLGPNYALLQPEYAELRAKTAPRTEVRRILIYFGAAYSDFAAEVAEAVLALRLPGIEIDLVVGSDSNIRTGIGATGTLRVHNHLPSLASAIAAADIGIGAVGSTSWERLCLGLPTVAITLADNQLAVAEELSQAALIHWLGSVSELSPHRIALEIAKHLPAGEMRAWSQRCMEACDGEGTRRVVERMLQMCQSD